MIERIDNWLRASKWNPVRVVFAMAALVLFGNLLIARFTSY